MTVERIRVFIAGNIYVKRALVRRFLEDDGYEVVGEARNREDMVAAVRREQPDAIVIDDELIIDGPGGGTMGRVRRASPDAKTIVFTTSPPEVANAPDGADGYLEKGLGLASLTALLGRLFAATGSPIPVSAEAALAAAVVSPETVDTLDLTSGAIANETDEMGEIGETDGDEDTGERELVGAGVGAGTASMAGATSALASSDRSSGANGSGRGARVAAIAAGAILIVSGLVAMIVSGGGGEPTRALDRTDTDTTGGTVVEPPADEQGPLDTAYGTLDEIIAALESGNYLLATVDAQALMDQRELARGAGFALTGLDAEITARLEVIVGDLPTRVSASLSEILGSLFPALAEDATQPGGGSAVVLGTTVSNPPSTEGGGTGTTPDTTGGDPPSSGDRTPPPGPGDGKTWGQSHHPDGGWHGDKPDHPHGKPAHDRTGPGKPPWAGP